MCTPLANTSITSIFNNHFAEFLDDIQNVFPEDVDIKAAKNSIITIRKANPKLLIKIWTKYVVLPYQKEIADGNIIFFVSKDYSSDLVKTDNAGQIMDVIDRLREPIKLMSCENQQKTMKYIQNLSKLALAAIETDK